MLANRPRSISCGLTTTLTKRKSNLARLKRHGILSQLKLDNMLAYREVVAPLKNAGKNEEAAIEGQKLTVVCQRSGSPSQM